MVDDGSTDGSDRIVEEFAQRNPGVVRLLRHGRNLGKGAAIRTAGAAEARGEFCLIQDADLEYDPREYNHLLKPLLDGDADAVYGSRFMIVAERRVMYYWHSLANRIMTEFCNLVADLNLTEMAYRLQGVPNCCAVCPKRRCARTASVSRKPEITIKLGRRRARVYEVPVSYHGRTYEEGKKIRTRDAWVILWTILRFSLTGDLYKDPGARTPLHALSAAPRFNRWMADTIRPHVRERGARNRGRHREPPTRALVQGRKLPTPPPTSTRSTWRGSSRALSIA